MSINPKDNLEAKEAFGANFKSLPSDVQDMIYHDIFSVGSKWILLSEIFRAKPERKLAMFRELKNLSQAELAEKAKVRQADVSNAENCIDKVRYGVIRKITECLGIPMAEILVDERETERSINKLPFNEEPLREGQK